MVTFVQPPKRKSRVTSKKVLDAVKLESSDSPAASPVVSSEIKTEPLTDTNTVPSTTDKQSTSAVDAHVSPQRRAVPGRLRDVDEDDESGPELLQDCEVCTHGTGEAFMLLCEGCDKVMR